MELGHKRFRLHKMKEAQRQQFRWSAHAGGLTNVKPRDYEAAGEFDAPSAYALWQSLRETAQALQLGDLLEMPDGELRVFKYIGFEEARWLVPAIDGEPAVAVSNQATVAG